MFSMWEAFAGCRVRLYLSSSNSFQSQSFSCSRAYCSDDCQSYDISSPSISSPSSTRSSPNLACAYGDEVPPLVPSALGSALKSYMAFNRYNVSSSSASSASQSFTDDEEDHFASGSSDHDVSDGIYDGNSKSVTIPSGLSYARRPSGTNNSSTVPHPHRRIFSDSSFAPVQNIPRSVPIYSHSHVDDDDYFDISSLPGDAVDADDSDLLSDQDWYRVKSKYQPSKTSKRSRTRGSLPACFSLLQTSSSKDTKSSPVLSSSSGNTIASPPTPKARFGNLLSQSQYPPAVHSTPRGRRRDPVSSRGARRTVDPSASGSRSGARPMAIEESSRRAEHSYSPNDVKGSTEKLVDWSHRGRATLRRNSSPLPKMLVGVEDPALGLGGAVKNRQEDSGSQFRVRRGRARVEDLGRDSYSTDAPGFGYGRSGLLDRERCTGAQSMRYLPC